MARGSVGRGRKTVAIFAGMVFGSFVAVLPPQGRDPEGRARRAMAERIAADVAAARPGARLLTPDGRCLRVEPEGVLVRCDPLDPTAISAGGQGSARKSVTLD